MHHLHPCPHPEGTRARTAWDAWARCVQSGYIMGEEPGEEFNTGQKPMQENPNIGIWDIAPPKVYRVVYPKRRRGRR